MKLSILTALVLISNAFSQEIHPEFHTFNEAAQDQILSSGRSEVIRFENWKIDSETKERVKAAIKNEGRNVFNIWGDTILGGDYTELGGQYWLQDYMVTLVDGKAAAFSAVTINKAIYYGDDYCDYTYFDAFNRWNDKCLELNMGEIREKFFVDILGNSLCLPSHTYSDFFFFQRQKSLVR